MHESNSNSLSGILGRKVHYVWNILIIYMFAQAIIGIISLEFAMRKTKRFREENEARDSKFPAFRRNDAHKWARWKFLPGAMLVMPTRMILLVLDAIFLVTFVS
jgi:hypothetical protein